MSQKLKCSYTVEAAFTMGILIFAVPHGILWAYGVKNRTVGAMMLEEAVEWIRSDEQCPLAEEAGAGMERLGFGITVRSEGERVDGTVSGAGWEREISMKRFRPEEFLRKISVIEGKLEDGNSLSEGDQP